MLEFISSYGKLEIFKTGPVIGLDNIHHIDFRHDILVIVVINIRI